MTWLCKKHKSCKINYLCYLNETKKDINTIFFQAESQFQLACPLLMKSISPETATQLNEKSFTELDKLFFLQEQSKRVRIIINKLSLYVHKIV